MEELTEVAMPRPKLLQSLLTVLKIPPAIDCCDGGREDITYIWAVLVKAMSQEIVGMNAYIGHVELNIGSNNNKNQCGKDKSPVGGVLLHEAQYQERGCICQRSDSS